MSRIKAQKFVPTLCCAVVVFLTTFQPAPTLADTPHFSGELTAQATTEVSYQSPEISQAIQHLPSRVPAQLVSTDSWRKEAKRVLHRLVGDDLNAFLGFEPELAILETPTLDAFVSSNGTLTVSHGMLVFLNSESEFAFLIAHEIAHVMLHHHEHKGMESSDIQEFVKREIEADHLALKLVSEAGFSTSAALSLVQRLGNFGRDQGLAMEEMYPSLRTRRLALQTDSQFQTEVPL